MWNPSYDIIVETLTGSEFEVTVNDRDTVGYLKSEIQRYEGIPISQQHLLYNHKELSDTMEMKDIPLVKGSRVKLVLGMKGGPISSKRLFTISSDYDNWLDMSDVLSGEDLINLQSPGLKLLLYKDNKKNVHRLMKVRAEKGCDGMKGSLSRSINGSGASGQGAFGAGNHISQKERDAIITKQKMDQIKAKLSMKKKKLNALHPTNSSAAEGDNGLQYRQKIENSGEERAGPSSGDAADAGIKAVRNQSHYRHNKRHHHYHHHHHHHHHQQHETVIKEEKTPIGYRPGASRGTASSSGGGAALLASGHNSSMVGAVGSMLPSAGTTSASHRKSVPSVIDVGRPEQEHTVPPFGYGLMNLLHGTASTAGRTPTLELEKRSQIREHLQRNRSFKTISAKNFDFTRDSSPQFGVGGGSMTGRLSGSAGLERSLSFHSNGVLNRMGSETTLDGYSNIRRCGTGGQMLSNPQHSTRLSGSAAGGAFTTQSLHKLDESAESSASLHNLIHLLKYTQSKQHTISNDSLNKLMLKYSKKVYVPHHLYHHSPVGKKSLPDINPSLNNIDEYVPEFDFGLKAPSSTATAAATAAGAIPKMITRSEDGSGCNVSSAEYAFKNAGGGGFEKTFRTLYKSTSDDSTVYELPKLLIREDSPVESFLGSYSQLETVTTRRADSPKNSFTSSKSLQNVDTNSVEDSDTQSVRPDAGLIELRPLGTNSTPSIVGETKLSSESLLQLAQIAAENVKSSTGTTATSVPSASMFGNNGNLVSSAVGNSSSSTTLMGSDEGGSSSTGWCHLWNHRQKQQNLHHHEDPVVSSSLQQLNNLHHHHSDLGINELEMKFVHSDGVSNCIAGERITEAIDELASKYTNRIKLPAIPNVEADNGWLQLSSWDTIRFGRDDEDADDEDIPYEEEVPGQGEEEEEADEDDDEIGQDQGRITSSSCSSARRPRDSSNSTSFIHSHLSISSDEDDLLNVTELREVAGLAGSAYKPGSNKSKSIDLNEFRKAFGSSPTLLNGFGGGTSCTRLVPQLSRLETIPSQYRRGYTNLNDACLSSSTSELECVSNGAAKKKHPGLLPPPCDDSGGLSSTLLKYRKDGNVPYVRSNENLNRYKVSLCTGSASVNSTARRRMGDSDEALTGNDALYLRQRQQSLPGSRHLPGIRDHLASIADSELNDSINGNGSSNGRSHATDENGNANTSFTIGGDFECRFSKLSCCSAPDEEGSLKPLSPGGHRATGANYRRKESSSTVGSNGLMHADSSTDDSSRFLFGEDGASMQFNGTSCSSSSTPLRPWDYYFNSDESLFNMDSFFDDFVEIDSCHIVDSCEYVNINSEPVGRNEDKSPSSASSNVLLPDIRPSQHHQRQQKHPQHEQQYPYFSSEEILELQQHQFYNSVKAAGATSVDEARNKHFFRAVDHRGGAVAPESDGAAETRFSGRRAFLQAGQQAGDNEEEGIASIIQHIDREQLCEQRASSADATIASSIIVHDDKERLLRLAEIPLDRKSPIGGMGIDTTQQHTTEQIKSKKLRCAQCNKKLGVIMIMKCHCEKIFCAQHRYAEAHNCSYDFKVEGRKILEKNNPLVVADKLPKI
ncbi:uncharacterized protein LOC128720805 [Anopheles nili]|uniref:uncharacterized protein LOC128720805 n=1 Tax=Anopheles nili TaxID=185578 RepID=UPI00237BC9CC|nr:uncharacterized protein LOC128720805 [Anopheles nili]